MSEEHLSLALSQIDPPLSVRAIRISESMSRPWEVEVLARSASPDLDLEAPIGRAASLGLRVQMQRQAIERSWTGLCTRMAQVRVEPDGLSSYRLTLRPALWALGQRRNYRLFQHVTVVDIARTLLDEWGIEHALRLDEPHYPKLELRTQYGESDYAFLSRMLEEAGIGHFFEDFAGTSKLVLCDAPQAGVLREVALRYTDNPSLHATRSEEFARAVHIDHLAVAASYTSRDYDFRRPGLELYGHAAAASEPEAPWEQFEYAPGGFLHDRNPPGATPHADDKGVGRHDGAFGAERATLAMQRARADKRAVSFHSNVIDLFPGRVFRIDEHPHKTLDETLLSLDNRIARDEDGNWTIETRSVPTSTPYRPPAITPKPRIEAVQSATVVGPAGDEIHTDEFGRVRVQFPWDRYGASDDNSSCWMRVNQGWAGAGFGSLNLPRIGQEVLVAFLDGNPDHPILVGRVFNEASPVPYKLPENKTVSTWKSNTSPTDGGFNELRFEDAQGRELVYFQAQKDAMGLVKHNEMLVVGNDRSRLVRGHETETIVKNQTKLVQGAVSTTIGDNESKTVSKSSMSTIGDTDASFVGKLFSVTIARSLAGPLGDTFGSMYSQMAPVLTAPLASTLGEVPATALGFPFQGSEHGPMATLGADLLPQALGLLSQGPTSIAQGGGRPPTGIQMMDEKIVLTTGGASITLSGDDITLSAKGSISSTSGKDTKIFAQASSITIQGGPMVYINPGEKSAEAMRMAQASHAGAAFIGGGHG